MYFLFLNRNLGRYQSSKLIIHHCGIKFWSYCLNQRGLNRLKKRGGFILPKLAFSFLLKLQTIGEQKNLSSTLKAKVCTRYENAVFCGFVSSWKWCTEEISFPILLFQYPILNTQSCIWRPLYSTFRFENLSISPKKPFFHFFGFKKLKKIKFL